MSKIKITQIKSVIDRSERQKRTVQALGLSKMNQSVEVEATPQIIGMVRKVNHLVAITTLQQSSVTVHTSESHLKGSLAKKKV